MRDLFSLLGTHRNSLAKGIAPALGAGLLLRIWYFLDLARQPYFNYPIVDSLTYDRLSMAFLAGEGGGGFFRPPLYPLFLAGLYGGAGHSQAVVVWSQFLLGLGSILPAVLLAQAWYGRRPAIVTAWILSLYPLRIFFEGELLDVTLFAFLFSWGVWSVWRGIEKGGSAFFLWGGLLLGCSALARPNVLLVVPCIAAGGYFASGRKMIPPRDLAALAVGLLLAISPATVKNWRAEKEVIPVAGNGGINFYLGNRPGSTGETPLPPGLQWQNVVQEPLREGKLSLYEQDRYWWRRAGRAVWNEPGKWARLLFRKTVLFWNASESSNNKNLGYFTSFSLPVEFYRGWFGLLVCAAAAGVAGFRKRSGTMFLIFLYGGFCLSVVLFFVTARYRLPLVLFLAPPAAAAFSALAERGGNGGKTGMLAAAAMAAILVFPGWLGAGEERIDHDFQMGQVFLMRGEPGRALEHLTRAASGDSNPDVHNSIAAAMVARGDLAAAEEHYRKALKAGEFSEVYYNLGIVLERQGGRRLQEAISAYRRALEINPLDSRAAANLDYLLSTAPSAGEGAGKTIETAGEGGK